MYLSHVTHINKEPIDTQDVDTHHQDVWTLFPGRNRNARDFVYKATKEGYYITSIGMPVSTDGQWNVNCKGFSQVAQLPVGARLEALVLLNATVRYDNKEHDSISHYKTVNAGKAISDWQKPETIIKDWLDKRAEMWGFSVESFTVKSIKRIPMARYSIMARELSMIITVNNPVRFTDTIFKGLGARRDRGFGMLQIRRI